MIKRMLAYPLGMASKFFVILVARMGLIVMEIGFLF